MSNKENNAKEHILAAARKLFAKEGYAKTSVSQIAKEAGSAKSLIYYYFKDKSNILEELVNRFVASMAAFKLPEEILGLSEKQVRAAELHHEKFISFIRKNSDILRILMRDALTEEGRSGLFLKLMNRQPAETPHDYLSQISEEERFAYFFFTIMPGISFICFEAGWKKIHGLNSNQMLQILFDMIASVKEIILQGPYNTQPPEVYESFKKHVSQMKALQKAADLKAGKNRVKP